MKSEAGIERSTRTRIDVVTWLSIYVGLLLFVPSKLVVGPLGSAGSPSMLFGLVSLLLWFIYRARASRPAPLDPQPIRIALYAFLFSVGITYALAMARPINVDEISPADVALLALASWSGTLLLAHDGIADRSRLETLLWRLAVGGGLIATLGIVQVFTGQIWVDRISIPGLTLTDAAGSFARGAFLRPAGLAVHPIEYGVLVTMLLPIALYVGFHQTEHGRFLRWLPALALAAIVPLTSSRSAYLGAAVGLAICMIGWTRERRLRVLGLGLAGIAAIVVVSPNLLNSIIGLFSGVSEDPSITSRTGSFDLAFEFFAHDPFFGRGLGTFLPKYRIFDNQYLVLLVTIGIVGVLVFIALGVVAAVTLLRLRRAIRDDRTRDLATSLVASIAVGFVGLVVFDAFAFPMTMGVLFLLLGVSGALSRLERATAKVGASMQ